MNTALNYQPEVLVDTVPYRASGIRDNPAKHE